MTSMTAYEAAQRALRAWAFALPRSLPSGCSVACSHGLPVAAARRDVARQPRVIYLKREGSLVAQAIETPYSVAQPEGPEPGLQDAPGLDGACLMQCLYMADRCDRNCAGCEVTASATGVERRACAAPTLGGSGQEGPDGNHGESNSTEGETP